MGKVVAIVLATSLSDSFFDEGDLYGITESRMRTKEAALRKAGQEGEWELY